MLSRLPSLKCLNNDFLFYLKYILSYVSYIDSTLKSKSYIVE